MNLHTKMYNFLEYDTFIKNYLKYATQDFAISKIRNCVLIFNLKETFTYNASKVIASNLRPLAKNDYTITNTLKISCIIEKCRP